MHANCPSLRVVVIIPCLDEEAVIGRVVAEMRRQALVERVIVVDNGSTDNSARVAEDAGAHVIAEPQRGYGRACLAGVSEASGADVYLFVDGDGSDSADEAQDLLRPIVEGQADMVIGSRVAGRIERGAMTLPQRFGSRLAAFLMQLRWGYRYTDLGPFRAITREGYERLGMSAKTYGWTVEMQARALKHDLRVLEVPVTYKCRVGVSKISGTVKGVALAGFHILTTIGREAVTRPFRWRTAPSERADAALPAQSSEVAP